MEITFYPALVAQCTQYLRNVPSAVYPALLAQCTQHWWRSVPSARGAVFKGAPPLVEQWEVDGGSGLVIPC